MDLYKLKLGDRFQEGDLPEVFEVEEIDKDVNPPVVYGRDQNDGDLVEFYYSNPDDAPKIVLIER